MKVGKKRRRKGRRKGGKGAGRGLNPSNENFRVRYSLAEITFDKICVPASLSLAHNNDLCCSASL